MHPDSIVVATGNLDEEGCGDHLLRERQRFRTVRLAKPTAEAWADWARNHGVAPEVVSFVMDFPAMFESFRDATIDKNPYIYHPEVMRATSSLRARSLTHRMS